VIGRVPTRGFAPERVKAQGKNTDVRQGGRLRAQGQNTDMRQGVEHIRKKRWLGYGMYAVHEAMSESESERKEHERGSDERERESVTMCT
jgi:hypothetical protein